MELILYGLYFILMIKAAVVQRRNFLIVWEALGSVALLGAV